MSAMWAVLHNNGAFCPVLWCGFRRCDFTLFSLPYKHQHRDLKEHVAFLSAHTIINTPWSST